MKTVSLKVDDALNAWLTGESKKLGRTRSDIVREALELKRRGLEGRTLHDILKPYCGIIKGGPRDLSTNKKHLKEFGRERRAA